MTDAPRSATSAGRLEAADVGADVDESSAQPLLSAAAAAAATRSRARRA